MSLLPDKFLSNQKPFFNPLLWGAFILYIFIAGITIANHEMWGDEIHSWNIVKGSTSYTELIQNIRYEGHPPVWYTILWPVSRFTHDTGYIQAVHLVIASLTVFLVLFFSNIPIALRVLIPFGYFFLYEYAVISRNYAGGILLAMSLCVIIHRHFRYKQLLYYVLLFLMTNTHLLAMLLAASIHLYFLLMKYEQKQKFSAIVCHAVIGILVALPSCYFMFPPSDSQMNTQFWVDKWDYHNLTAFIQAPIRSFVPMPAWWSTNFWHTQFLTELKDTHVLLKALYILTALLFVWLAYTILKTNRKSLILFLANFSLSFIVAVLVFPMTSARYAGFLYIGFIVAFWLCCNESVIDKSKKRLMALLLLVQMCGGIFASLTDIQKPFSYAYAVKELAGKVPAGEKVVTDYWAMNVVSAFADKPMYCVDMEKEASFLLWDGSLAAIYKKQYRYTEGIEHYFQKENIHSVYMISTAPPELIYKADTQLNKQYQVQVIEKREGAIEKGGNLYLYHVTSN